MKNIDAMGGITGEWLKMLADEGHGYANPEIEVVGLDLRPGNPCAVETRPNSGDDCCAGGSVDGGSFVVETRGANGVALPEEETLALVETLMLLHPNQWG